MKQVASSRRKRGVAAEFEESTGIAMSWTSIQGMEIQGMCWHRMGESGTGSGSRKWLIAGVVPLSDSSIASVSTWSWSYSRCQDPAQRCSGVYTVGNYAGWHCHVTSRWTLFMCPWSGKQGATATRPSTVCELLATFA